MEHQTQEHKHNENLLFLPSVFKNVGYIILLTGAVLTIFTRIVGLSIQAELIKSIAFVVLAISLICIIWAKDENHDEFWILVKLKATQAAFLASILFLIVLRISSNLSLKENASELALVMIFVYFLTFKFQKARIRRQR